MNPYLPATNTRRESALCYGEAKTIPHINLRKLEAARAMNKMAFGDSISGKLEWARPKCHMHLRNLHFKCRGTQSVYDSRLAVMWCYLTVAACQACQGPAYEVLTFQLKACREENKSRCWTQQTAPPFPLSYLLLPF